MNPQDKTYGLMALYVILGLSEIPYGSIPAFVGMILDYCECGNLSGCFRSSAVVGENARLADRWIWCGVVYILVGGEVWPFFC